MISDFFLLLLEHTQLWPLGCHLPAPWCWRHHFTALGEKQGKQMTLPSKRSDKQRAAPLQEEGKWVGRLDLGLEVGNLGISPAARRRGLGKGTCGRWEGGVRGKAGMSHPGVMGVLGCAPWAVGMEQQNPWHRDCTMVWGGKDLNPIPSIPSHPTYPIPLISSH